MKDIRLTMPRNKISLDFISYRHFAFAFLLCFSWPTTNCCCFADLLVFLQAVSAHFVIRKMGIDPKGCGIQLLELARTEIALQFPEHTPQIPIIYTKISLIPAKSEIIRNNQRSLGQKCHWKTCSVFSPFRWRQNGEHRLRKHCFTSNREFRFFRWGFLVTNRRKHCMWHKSCGTKTIQKHRIGSQE